MDLWLVDLWQVFKVDVVDVVVKKSIEFVAPQTPLLGALRGSRFCGALPQHGGRRGEPITLIHVNSL